MAQEPDYDTFAEIYSRGGRQALEGALAHYAPRASWASLHDAENLAVQVVEGAAARTVAHVDQLEAQAAALAAEIKRKRARIQVYEREIESINSAALSRFLDDVDPGTVPRS
ncbi:hypothetical protein PV371_36105 [Streptomyces sp. TX20-6-3]|uniref:hypothetical protein n=1 Tax=Streptomyces sp. TX20-6-3 TaxID=3028705 RepID=UPI0029AF3950|nr:hypothetical protein [Streptomyces sp. TX20-6-3]MDX2565051.1 hypothetical protein [Streptomyces sp. TX20-6-3]